MVSSAPEVSYARYEAARNHFRGFFQNSDSNFPAGLELLRAPEDKISALAEALETFLGEDASRPVLNLKDLERITEEARITTRPLDGTEARRIIENLLLNGDRDQDLGRYFGADVTRTIDRRLRERWLYSESSDELVDTLSALGLSNDESIVDAARARLFKLRQWGPLIRSTLATATLWWMGFFPVVDIPDPRLIGLAAMPASVDEQLQAGNLSLAREIALQLMSRRTRWSTRLNTARRIYFSVLTGIGLFYVAEALPLIRNVIMMPFLSRDRLESYQKTHYSAPAEVQKQLDSWLSAQTTRPSPEEITKKKLYFEDQERRGIFRINSAYAVK